MQPQVSPDSQSPDPSQSTKFLGVSLGHWLRGLAFAGGVLVVGGGALGWMGWTFLKRELPPFLEENISGALGRPLKLGEFERFSLAGIRFGDSILPPTPDNFTWAKAKAVDISFNPLQLVFQRTLRPSIILVEPEVAIKQGFNREWQLQPPNSAETEGLIKTELNRIQIRNATLAIGPVARRSIIPAPEGVVSSALIVLQNVNLRLNFSGEDNQDASFIVGGRLNNGAFQLRGAGQLDTRNLNLQLRSQQIPINTINPLLGGHLFIRDGLLSSNLDMRVRPDTAEPVNVTGTAKLRQGDIAITDLPAAVTDINGTLVLDGLGGELQNSSLKYGPILVDALGRVDLEAGYNLQVEIPDMSIAQLEEAFAQPLPVAAAGRFRIDTAITGALLDPQVAGTLRNLEALQVDRLGIDTVAADFSADIRNFRLDRAEMRPTTGGTITAQGQVDFSQDLLSPDVAFSARTDVPLDAIATLYDLPSLGGFRFGPLQAQAQLTGKPDDFQAVAQWALPEATAPGAGQLAFADNLLRLRDTQFQVGSGELAVAADANLNNQAWQAQINGNALELAALSPLLRGILTTSIAASGRLTSLTLADTRAQGQIRLSPAIPVSLEGAETLISDPLEAQFAWTGDTLQVPQVQAGETLAASGFATLTNTRRGIPAVSGFDFNARLQSFDLGGIYGLLEAPEWLALAGLVDFDGRLSGTPAAPLLAGSLGLRQFAVNQFVLAPEVRGPIRASLTEGALVDLRGGNTEIYAEIDPSLRPNQFRFINGDLRVAGQRRGDILNATVENFDLGLLTIRPLETPDLGTLSGLLNARAQINLADILDPDVQAEFAIATPALGTIAAEDFRGQVAYTNGTASLTGGLLRLTPDTELSLTASGRLFPEWSLTAQLTAEDAQIQDLLATIGLYRFASLGALFQTEATGSAADLAIEPVGDPRAPLPEQADLARRYRQEQLAAAQEQRILIPDLDELEGSISGTALLQASATAGIAARFDFSGQNWIWGPYDFENQFVARGRLDQDRLLIDPLEFRAGDTRLALTGIASLEASNLQFRAEHLPLSAAAEVAELPVEIVGDLNLAADLSGGLGNPQIVGQLSVDNALVNQQPLQEVSSTFQYQDAVFSLEGRVQNDAPEPLLFSGTVPYALPFMTVLPPSNQIALRASLKNEALSLVNLFTPAVTWGGGQANIDLQLGGTLASPTIDGIAAFQGATFNSPLLNAELANLNGILRFTDNHLRSEEFGGALLGGQFAVLGQLPLYPQDAHADKQLQIVLDTIDFNYADEVISRVDGQIAIANALLQPTIGGGLLFQDTLVSVGPELTQLANQALAEPGFSAEVERLLGKLQAVPATFDDFRVVLEPAQIKGYPLFSLDLAGNVGISGPVGNPYTSGVVVLNDAWINTITTEFSLVRSYDNVVIFAPEQGLIPYLDLRFVALVPLQRNYNLAAPAEVIGNNAEIPDLESLAANTIFDEIRVEARVRGLANRMFDTLTLTSNPSYGESDLLSMVSGGYLSDLGGGEPSLALASNLLAALGAGTQDEIAQSLGLRRLRLSASTVLPTDEGDTLGYGVGLNVGITENLSTTFIQVLNQNQPYQLNVRYRISDELGVGGSSNFGDENRLFIEYRFDF